MTLLQQDHNRTSTDNDSKKDQTNEEPEEVIEGYKSGGYVAIIAEKN